MTRLLVPALALLVGLAGCAPRPLVRDAPDTETATGYPNHTAAQIVALVEASVAPVRAVSADGPLAFSQGGRSQEATFSLRARTTGAGTDSLTLVIRGPLGIEGARALVTSDAFVAADRINRRLYTGDVAAAERYVPGGGSPDALARAALGLLAPDAGARWTVTPGPMDAHYLLRAPLEGGGTREMMVNAAVWRVVRVRDLDASGAVVAEQEASAFDRVDGVVVPRRVRVAGGGGEATFEHRALTLNPPDLRLRFTAPTGYEVVELP